MNDILIVAAHPDDEVLGCGGTIAKHTDAGDHVFVIFMADGVGSRNPTEIQISQARKQDANKALSILGVSDVFSFDFPDNQMDSIPLLTVVQEIEKVINLVSPRIVYTHFGGDLNIDHKMTNKAVLTACRPQAQCSVKEIYCFEVLSSTEWNSKSEQQFIPQKFVDVTQQWDRKMKSLKCYNQEIREFPHSRSYKCVEALAAYRGATNGIKQAEAFFIERIIS